MVLHKKTTVTSKYPSVFDKVQGRLVNNMNFFEVPNWIDGTVLQPILPHGELH